MRVTGNDRNRDGKNLRPVIHNILSLQQNDSMTAMTANPVTLLLSGKRLWPSRILERVDLPKSETPDAIHRGFPNSQTRLRGEYEFVTRKTRFRQQKRSQGLL